jgi:hypothetical protein
MMLRPVLERERERGDLAGLPAGRMQPQTTGRPRLASDQGPSRQPARRSVGWLI